MVLSISLETENDIINLKRDTMETNKSQIQKSEYAPFNKWRRKNGSNIKRAKMENTYSAEILKFK